MASFQPRLRRDDAPAIDESSVAFVYETKADVPTPEDKLAAYISADYANAPDEFQQHTMLEKLRPIIKKRLDAAKATSTFVLRIAFQLPKYDFDRHGFPSTLSETTIVPYQNNYIVKFSNWDQMDLVPIDELKAQTLDLTLRRSRQAILRVYGSVDTCKEEEVNGIRSKVLYIKASKLVLSVGDSSKFAGEKTIAQ